MGIFRRIFSTDFRRAVAAEAEGDYLTAAQAFALCGETEKVVDMHLALARQADDEDHRARELRLALHFAGQDDRRRPMVLRMLAEVLISQGRARGVETQAGRERLEEAADLLLKGEGWQQAGDCYLELGDRERAAEAYARGGLVERVEQVLGEEERRRERAMAEDRLFKDHEMELGLGQRDKAADLLRRCVELAPEPGAYRRLLSDLERTLLHGGRMTLRLGEQRVILLGRFPIIVGRDQDCDLSVRGHSVSRRHACVLSGEDGAVYLEDMGSRNGLLLSGVRLGARVPLPEAGTMGLGDDCEISFCRQERLTLEVTSGLDRGTRAVLLDAACPLDRLLTGAPPLSISFDRGRPMLRIQDEGVRLNGEVVSGTIQLIMEDQVQVPGCPEPLRVEG